VEDRISGFEHKVYLIEKPDEYKEKRINIMKGICKTSTTSLKDQIYKSWALK
jgi:hypothetical protein